MKLDLRPLRRVTAIAVVAVACGCQSTTPAVDTTASQTLTGVVIRKDWSKSPESWNAGGSEYYVLRVEGATLPPSKKSAMEGVILRPSSAIPFGRFANLVGQRVTCRGEFVAGEPYIPRKDSGEQMPAALPNPITAETEHPIVGAGFKVNALIAVEKK